MEWLQANWVSIVALLWVIDQGLKIVAAWTKNKVDDNISDILGKVLTTFFRKGQ